MLKAVNINGLCLEFASSDLKNDLEVVTEAIKKDPLAIKFASEEVFNSNEEMKVK